ncbi:FadR/GntR family transcriptional regulator [Ruania zhangjianzhongii]|uniref:FadR/GntR family transcriptional regulator n=1 Tax=Ruania zhangjianzhongii TaxID=2603206 RepID=UPI001F1724C0|nr:FadR/GntR family transcriptional regulator [Ruania zhangjianzhongii]
MIRSLVTEIVVGTYPPGSPLPSAGVLGEHYQVSRTVIREATTSLTEKGLVATRQGWGTVVLDQGQWSLLDPMVLDALFQREDRLVYLDNLIEIRALLECSMASRAADRIDDSGRRELRAAVERLNGLRHDPDAYPPADIDFHECIHQISEDAFGRAIVKSIQGKAVRSPQYRGRPGEEEMAITHQAHTKIADAILDGDPDAAAAAMREHITSSWDRRRPNATEPVQAT